MDNTFCDEEKLYRAIFPAETHPYFWKKNGELSSAAFKKKGDGLSVERGDFRSDEAVVKEMLVFFIGNIISVTVGQCRDVEAYVIYKPTERSKYHSEIRGGRDRIGLSPSQARKLASAAIKQY